MQNRLQANNCQVGIKKVQPVTLEVSTGLGLYWKMAITYQCSIIFTAGTADSLKGQARALVWIPWPP